MDFSSLPPNWQQQPNQQSASSSANTNNNPEAQILQPHGGSIRPGSMADRARMANIAMPEAALKCPRCESTNTKFCYFNNYSLTQPRHLCKTCRRYWTRGGALRNVPVGGGCRRNKRSSSSSSKAPSNKASTAEILHLPALRFMPTPLHHPDFTASGDMGLSYGPADLGFHMTTEQWRLQAPAAQFPFLPADFDGATSSGITQQMASVKMEDSNNQMAGIRHLLGTDHHQYYWNNNSNIIINNYASSATAWTHLSGFSSSSTTSNQL